MRKDLKLFVLLLISLVIACTDQIERKYYDSGQLKEQRHYKRKNDTLNFHSLTYYSNGQIKSKGRIVNGEKQGQWEEWYSDGAILWVGNYSSGTRELEIVPHLRSSIVFSDSILKKGKVTYFRVSVDGIHPKDFSVGCINGDVQRLGNNDLFEHQVIPRELGPITFFYFLYSDLIIRQVQGDTMLVVD